MAGNSIQYLSNPFWPQVVGYEAHGISNLHTGPSWAMRVLDVRRTAGRGRQVTVDTS